MAENVHENDLWEYNAPQFVDFASSNPQEDDDADSWFDTVDENGLKQPTVVDDKNICADVEIIDADKIIEDNATTPTSGNRRLTQSMIKTPSNDKGLPEATELNDEARPRAEVDEGTTAKKTQAADENPNPKAPRNICTDLDEWRRKTKTIKDANKPQSAVDKQLTRSTETRSRTIRRSQTVRVQSKEDVRETRRSAEISTRGHSATLKRSESLKRSTETRSRTIRRSQTVRVQSKEDERETRRSAEISTRGHSATLKRSESLKRPSDDKVQNLWSKNRINSTDNHQRKKLHTRGLSADTVSVEKLANSSTSSSVSDGVPTASKMPKLTLPSMPTVLTRKSAQKANGEKVLSREERELETIAQLRNEMAKKRKMAQDSYKKALSTTAYVPVHSKAIPTMPQNIQFHTDERIKSHGMETRAESKQKDFVKSLRSTQSPPTQAPINRGPTEPKPFHLAETRKRKFGSMEDLTKSSYHSMAEKITAFQKETPERFRSRPRMKSVDHAPANNCRRGRSASPKILTVPKTPLFETKSRGRPVSVPSRQEVEDQEVLEMKRNQFKAHPVNQRIMKYANTGVKKIPTKPVTEPEEFHLSSQRRAQEYEANSPVEKEKFEFHANPVPKKILEGPVGVKPAKLIPATVPKSPAFALKHRARAPVEMPEEHNTKLVKSHPLPHSGLPFVPKLGHKKTVPAPFSFEERDRTTQLKKEEKIKEILDEEKKAREFHASRYTSPVLENNLPPKHPKPATVPQPFNLEVDNRGQRKQEEWHNKLEEEIQQQKQLTVFKARPGDIVYKEPFIPDKSSRPLTDVSDFELNTEKRSVTREYFERYKKAKESEIEALKRQKEKEQEEEDKIAVAKLRAELVHKSKPPKNYKTVQVQPSNKPLTKPSTPKFNTDQRLRSKIHL